MAARFVSAQLLLSLCAPSLCNAGFIRALALLFRVRSAYKTFGFVAGLPASLTTYGHKTFGFIRHAPGLVPFDLAREN